MHHVHRIKFNTGIKTPAAHLREHFSVYYIALVQEVVSVSSNVKFKAISLLQLRSKAPNRHELHHGSRSSAQQQRIVAIIVERCGRTERGWLRGLCLLDIDTQIGLGLDSKLVCGPVPDISQSVTGYKICTDSCTITPRRFRLYTTIYILVNPTSTTPSSSMESEEARPPRTSPSPRVDESSCREPAGPSVFESTAHFFLNGFKKYLLEVVALADRYERKS